MSNTKFPFLGVHFTPMIDGNIRVLNAPSPAATSCLAIADEIVKKNK